MSPATIDDEIHVPTVILLGATTTTLYRIFNIPLPVFPTLWPICHGAAAVTAAMLPVVL
jgi:hypothetical protein